MRGTALARRRSAETITGGGGGGWTPASITGLIAWYKGDAGVTSAGGYVSQWDDQSGNGYHMTQSTGDASFQPITGTRTINGINGLDFSGVRYLLNASMPNAVADRFMLVVTYRDGGSEDVILGGHTGTTGKFEWRIRNGTGAGQDVLQGGVSHRIPTGQTTSPTSTAYCPSVQVTGGLAGTWSLKTYLSNVQDGTTLTGSGSWTSSTGVRVGWDQPSGTGFDGIIGEIVVVDAVVSSTDRALLQNYIATKWGITAGPFNASGWGDVLGEYDYSVTANITESGGAVSSVAPTSGWWALTIVQATAGTKPTTGTRTATGGKNVLDFDGGDRLTGDPANQSQPHTLVGVIKADVTSGERHIFGYHSSGSLIGIRNNKWAFWTGSVGFVESGTSVDTGWHVLVGTFNGATSNLYLDGTQIITNGNPGVGGIDVIHIGNEVGGTTGWDGCIGHAIAYAGMIANPTGLSAALKTYWGI